MEGGEMIILDDADDLTLSMSPGITVKGLANRTVQPQGPCCTFIYDIRSRVIELAGEVPPLQYCDVHRIHITFIHAQHPDIVGYVIDARLLTLRDDCLDTQTFADKTAGASNGEDIRIPEEFVFEYVCVAERHSAQFSVKFHIHNLFFVESEILVLHQSHLLPHDQGSGDERYRHDKLKHHQSASHQVRHRPWSFVCAQEGSRFKTGDEEGRI